MSFYHFPSEFVYWDKVKNHDEIKKEILPKILEANKNKKNNPFSACKFNTSFKHNDEPDLNVMNKKMLDVIIFYLEKMFKAMDFNPGKINIRDGWWNVYDEGEFQEEHAHFGPPTYFHGDMFYPAFSIIYILHDENEKSSIIFKKGGPLPLMEPHYEKVFKTEDVKEIKEGTILIFPYTLRHLVKPCIKPGRVTLAYNIYSVYK
jgi:hypothetical protein